MVILGGAEVRTTKTRPYIGYCFFYIYKTNIFNARRPYIYLVYIPQDSKNTLFSPSPIRFQFRFIPHNDPPPFSPVDFLN